MKKELILEKITYKKLAVILLGLFVVTLLPIIYCSFFDYANGDDLWEGAVAYRVLAEGGTIKDFFVAIRDWFIVDYYGWEGNWASIILWCLEPSIWGEKVYCITPWIALIHLCGGATYFLCYYSKKYLNGKATYQAVISLLACFFIIQYMPSVKNGVFWYTGMINYMVPFSLCIISFVWMDKYMEKGLKRYLIYTIIIFSYLGGAGYTPIVLAFEVLVLIILYYGINLRFRNKRVLLLLLPLLLLMVGFFISAVSPGNAVRGGESYTFDILRVFMTIIECIKQGIVGIFKWFITVRPLVLVIPILLVMTWECIDVKETKMEFAHPIWVSVILFLISCSLYAPEIYSQSEVSGGVPNTIYFTFLIAVLLDIVYLTCYVKKRYIYSNKTFITAELLLKLRVAIIVGEVFFCVMAGRFLISNMSGYICYDFIRTGQLRDYVFQMEERLEILHNQEIREVVLPEMNDQQGPFMHMPIIDNPEAYTNSATARFYGKDSVIAIPRLEYYELYGYPEEE